VRAEEFHRCVGILPYGKALPGARYIQSVSPLALEVAINVQEELQKRVAESDRLRRQYVERAHYEAEQARIRYMRVDPLNRLVADTLEGLWNDKLRQLEQACEDYEKQRESGARSITQEQKTVEDKPLPAQAMLALASRSIRYPQKTAKTPPPPTRNIGWR
jgi:hypothetical protein